MIVKGTYTSVWDDDICVTSKVEVDTETHAIEFLEEPKEISGVNACTDEYVMLPWNDETQKVDPNGKGWVNIKVYLGGDGYICG